MNDLHEPHNYVNEIEQAIQDMAAKAASLQLGDIPLETGYSGGWWVLAVGEPLDPHSLEQREHAREALLRELSQCNIPLAKYIWIWDETGCAQVVLRSFEHRDLAEAFAAAMKKRGLRVRVAREWDTQENV